MKPKSDVWEHFIAFDEASNVLTVSNVTKAFGFCTSFETSLSSFGCFLAATPVAQASTERVFCRWSSPAFL